MSKRKAFVNFVKAENVLFLVAVTALALLFRLKFFGYESSDYHQFLQGWFALLKQNGGLAAAGLHFGDYTPLYYYFLALLTCLPVRDLYLIKMLSCVFDLVMAYFVYRLVNLKYNEFWGEISYAVALFLPSVIINSAVWAQCDCMYTAALLATVYYVMTGRNGRAMVAYGIAFSLKLQAVFLAPFLLLLFLKRKIRWRNALIIPAVYLVSILPAAFLGRDFRELLTVYFRQAGEYKQLTMNLPNLYTWFPARSPAWVGPAGVLLAGAVVLLTLIYFAHKKFRLTNEMLISFALFYAVLVPYFLPYMHERYYYPADLLSVVFAFYFPEKFYVPIITVLSSTYATCRFLFGAHFISMKVFSVMMLFNLIWVGIHIIYRIRDGGAGKVERASWADS